MGWALLLGRMVVICILGQVGGLGFGGWLLVVLILWIPGAVLCRGLFVIVVVVVVGWGYFIGGVATSVCC